MKKLFTIIFIVISINAFCQDDTLPYHDDNIRIDTGYGLSAPIATAVIDTDYIITNSPFIILGGRSKPNDTVAVIFLCTDTSGFAMTRVMIGYSVYKYIPEHWGAGDAYVLGGYRLQGYLSNDGKPLSKDIIVWLSKELNHE